MLVLRELKPDTFLNSHHSIEAAFYKVRVTMTTDTILMQRHKCFTDLSSMLEAVAGCTLTGCYVCRPRACVVCFCVSPDLSTNRGSLAPAQEPRAQVAAALCNSDNNTITHTASWPHMSCRDCFNFFRGTFVSSSIKCSDIK